ncbi:dipeptidase [Actinoplanes sp. NPDC051861]|uniref:dipeptidase n=1 Tax=Actinoplanes sp. NPDC051861 TaxID=3155170 RepID=UPI00341A4308
MAVPLSDPRFTAVPILDCGEPLVDLGEAAPLLVAAAAAGTPNVYLRTGVVDRLVIAQSLLPRELRLLILSGHLPAAGQATDPAALACWNARPATLPPHLTGGAVDLTLIGPGTHGPIESLDGDRHRLLSAALRGSGLVEHPTSRWHWSYGDQYWAYMTSAATARYGDAQAVV